VGLLIKSYDQFRSNLMDMRSGQLQPIAPSDVLTRFIGPFDGNSNKRISDIVVDLAG
jgi:hypothetical protein